MLINASRPAEVRAAILQNGRLDQLEIEVREAGLLKGNVYKGKIANVEGSLNACFVEFGADKQGFLPIDEIAPACYHRKWKKKEKPRVTDVVQKGREVVVQVVKDAIGNKGAALTTRISLAGRYIVLMPLDESRGISRKVGSDSQRKKIKELAESLKIPEEYGFIIRTAGLDRTKTDLNRDAALLTRTWKNISKGSDGASAPTLLHEDRDLVVRMLRDYYDSDVTRILIDEPMSFAKAEQYFKVVMPRTKGVLEHYTNKVPLFSRYQVEDQVEAIYHRRANLKSGGYILIDPTEALTAIDINSGRSTKQKSQEETALHTNMEAAGEVARQLRLRDVGGLIVVDFIDMPSRSNNRKVEKALKDALKPDKARTYVSKISDNGLLEINRQRLKQSLQLQTHRDCPTCKGRGVIENPSTVARSLLRGIEAKAASGSYGKVVVQLHPELADYIQNLCRRELIELEERFALILAIEGRPGYHRSEREVKWINSDNLSEGERRMVEERRSAMIAANRRLNAEIPLEPEDTVDEMLAELTALHEELGEPEEEEEETRTRARSSRRSRTDDDDDDGDGGEATRRSRRGRGRGRSRGRGRAGARADSHDDLRAYPDRDEDDEPEGREGRGSRRRDGRDSGGRRDERGGGDDDDGQAMSRSQRRRMRRKRNRSEDGGEDTREQAAAPKADAEPPSEGDDGEGGPRRRRRRRRRRGRGRGRGEEGETEAAAEGGAAEEASTDDGEDATASQTAPTMLMDAPAPPAPPAAAEATDAAEEEEEEDETDDAESTVPPGESLAPPAGDSLFKGLKRYLGLGGGSSDASGS